MKKLLLALFLLTAGIVTSQYVNAQLPKEYREVSKVPPAVQKTFDNLVILATGYDPTADLIDVTWYVNKGNFYAEATYQSDIYGWGIILIGFTPRGEAFLPE